MSKETNHFYEFGPFRVDVARQLLLRDGQPVPLTAKAFETLLVLVKHGEEMVSKDELMKQLWPDTFVEESNLTQHVSMLRKALGESPQDHRYIVTMPGRGYRFAQKVREVPDGGDLVVQSHTVERVTVEEIESRPYSAAGAPPWRSALVVGLLAILLVVSYLAWHRIHPPALPPLGRIMLAVLPFQNLTGDPEQEYLSDGVTEEMITQLGRLQPERLGVIARTSVMGYKHGDERMDQIGRELGVQYILEGSVRRDGNRMRITAQLIQVKDQSHLWAREYEHSLKDLFALQDDVTAGVAAEIQSRLALEARNRAGRSHRVTPEAYDAYLMGRYSLNGRTAAGLHNAERYFHVAIAADPNYGLAYTGLAESYLLMAANGSSLQAVSLQARTAAKKALSIDPTLGEPHAILALIAQNYDWNWEESEREFELAMTMDPNDATPHHWYSAGLAVRGRFEECFRENAIARQLDPLSLVIRSAEGEYPYLARRYDEAIGKLDRTLEVDPNVAPAHFARGLSYEQKGKWREALADLETAKRLDDTPHYAAMLGEAYALSGDKSRARQILRELQARAKREDVSALYPAIIYAGLGEKDAAFAGLEGAFEERATYLLGLKTAAIYDPLRSDPRFDVLLKRMGLPQ
jgi:TolB-like protein/DNA-binding winged helix-turn-helix (wHTH) protein/Flp pilus assembly protein TadD